jgi:hypothetical protein
LFVLNENFPGAAGSGMLYGRRAFFADPAIPTKGQPSLVSVMERIPLLEVGKIFPAPHAIALGTGAFGDPQLTGLIGADDHFAAISNQPSIYDHCRGCHRVLLLSARAACLRGVEMAWKWKKGLFSFS